MPVALVTRPTEDSQAVAAELASRGLDVVTEPLLDIRPLDGVEVVTDGVQGILATSANGVRALARILPDRSLPVWAVGDATARVARDFGYADVEAAGGDVDSLAALVSGRCDPGAGAFLHAAGTVLAGDLAGMLGSRDFEVRRVVLYEAVTATALSPSLVAQLQGGGIDIALFFSPRTAATFATLVNKAGVSETLARVVAYALSPAVARELSGLPWRAVHAAAAPSQAALLAALDEDREQGDSMTQTDQPQSGEPGPQPTADAPADQPETADASNPAKRLPRGLIIAALVVALLAIGAVLTWPAWRHLIAPAPAPVTQAAPESGAEVAALRAELDRLRQRVEVLEDRPIPESAPIASAPAEFDPTSLDSRIGRIEESVRILAQRPQLPSDLAETVTALSLQVTELRRTAADSATVLRLADRVDQVEAQTRDMQQQRGSAAAMLLAVGQLREAVNGAMPFEAELRTVRALAPPTLDIAEPVETLKRRAASGIPTRQDLAQRFDLLAADLVRAEILPQGEGWWRDTLARLSTLVIVRREDGQTAGDGTAAIVARTETRLSDTDLAGAVAEAGALDGAAAERAGPWLADAQARLAADKALSVLTAETLAALGSR